LLSFLSWGPNALSPIVLALQAKRYLALSRARLQKNEKEKKKVRFLALLTAHTTLQIVLELYRYAHILLSPFPFLHLSCRLNFSDLLLVSVIIRNWYYPLTVKFLFISSNICRLLPLNSTSQWTPLHLANITNCIYYLVQIFMELCRYNSCLGQMKLVLYRYAIDSIAFNQCSYI